MRGLAPVAALLLTLPVSGYGQVERMVADSVIAIEVPVEWVPGPGTPDMSIAVSTAGQDAGFVVIVEHKDDMFGWNLDKYSYVTLAQSLAVMDLPVLDGPTPVSVADAKAVRWDFEGSVNGVFQHYAKIAIDAPTAWVQLVGWTTRSDWDTLGPVIEAMIESAELVR